ncbi:benzoate/H(+) symporter BenE family transporter [Colwellia sp. M166]|uniref:benzoate/H(+) symporter BenE family transporter n=1 Tax=Colwellia sp. M166 TaxID=2583805 RepID=UPI00211DBA6C|nr:benzoate/H(+) symporter BenE family transporter [Colwellia sp. M166]UUO22488.1 benzoate/H(+) symporter BenE family transporter [Colwellia sp. M166]|tara:strand:- start:67 stop:1254 length:1188 start_codon:yes stop_codon:yes gene_type:complete
MLVNRIISSTVAGLVAVVIGFASSVALIYQTVINLGGDASLASSWILTLGLSMGITSIALSFYYRVPILIAWSTPGAALLIANTQNFNLNEAIAGFMFSALLIFLCGITGWFEKLINKLPFQLASAMLGGILINFGIGVFNQMNETPLLVIVMFVTYLVCRQLIPKFTMLVVLLISVITAWQLKLMTFTAFSWRLSEFTYISPEFSISAILGIGIPLFLVTMAAQNLPGIAVLKAHNYKAPVSSILSVTGFVNMLAAPFGGYAINLAAITAAICMTEDVNKNPEKRYWAAISGGGFYLLMGISAGYLMEAFSSLPNALIYSLAGIALFTTINSSIQQALSEDKMSEAAIITFLVTASNLTLWGISSVLWGLIAGSITLIAQNLLKKSNYKRTDII